MRALVIRPTRPRLAAALLYNRVTGKPAVFPGGPLELVEAPEPELPGPQFVKVRSRLAGICGSDLKTLRLKLSTRSARLAAQSPGGGLRFQGHETVGEVVAVGSAVTRHKPGDRVVMIPATHCAALGREAPCRPCRDGAYCLCEHHDEPLPGEPLGGGWSEFFVRHESQLHPVRESLPDEQAVLFEPLACSLHAVLRHPPEHGARVLILGGGMIGLGIVHALRALGRELEVHVMVRHPFQADLAGKAGADSVITSSDPYAELASRTGDSVVGSRTDNRLLKRGVDLVIDAVGSAATLHLALRTARPGGTVVFEGVDLQPGPLDRTPLWWRELNLLGANGHGRDSWEGEAMATFERVEHWVADGRLSTAGLLSHRFPLEDYRPALTAAADKRRHASVKVAFEFPTPDAS